MEDIGTIQLNNKVKSSDKMEDEQTKSDYKIRTFDEIQGLRYINRIITKDEEKAILKEIYEQEWNTQLKRRTQHYGYRYDYSVKSIDQNMYLGKLPQYALDICQKLIENKIIKFMPDQMIINEYTPGQGINPHIDKADIFGETIFSISLGSKCVMTFSYENQSYDVLLRRRSIAILEDKARYQFKHSIASRKSDKFEGKVIQRKTRVSLTFRKVIDTKQK